MLQWFRIRASAIALVAITALAATGAAALAPHDDDCHDGACVLVQHDASAHQMRAPSVGDPHQDHCLVCHWTRSFRLRTEARILPAPVGDSGELLLVEHPAPASSAPLAQPPLRSPPSSPVRS
jgi:hypothetical protein